MKLTAKHTSKIKVKMSPEEASIICVALMHARSSDPDTQARVESTYTALYMALEDAGFSPTSGALQLKKPTRVKPAEDDGDDEPEAPEAPAAPWPPVVGQEVEARAYGCDLEDGFVRTKILDVESGELDIYTVKVRDEIGHEVRVTRTLDELRPVSS